jgi:hypothetical protein
MQIPALVEPVANDGFCARLVEIAPTNPWLAVAGTHERLWRSQA